MQRRENSNIRSDERQKILAKINLYFELYFELQIY